LTRESIRRKKKEKREREKGDPAKRYLSVKRSPKKEVSPSEPQLAQHSGKSLGTEKKLDLLCEPKNHDQVFESWWGRRTRDFFKKKKKKKKKKTPM